LRVAIPGHTPKIGPESPLLNVIDPIVHPDQCDSNESSTQNEGTSQITGNPYIVAIQVKVYF
jgi:hypothetical protein